jgi:basic membrane lipoprotein Med (substrate-binding protein (PBP1-ABC) superfamily)/ABC-type uncharacterized transport system substrate-binding protein
MTDFHQYHTVDDTVSMKRFRLFWTVIFRVLVVCLLIAGWNTSNCLADSPPLKIAFLYNGPVGDGGWNYGHEMARLKLADDFPDIETLAVANVPVEDAGKIMKNLVQQGTKAIFATSADFSPAVELLAGRFPDTTFFLCDGTFRAANVTTYCGKIHQPAYLCGILAARMSTTNHIGFLGEIPSPAILSMLNAFVLGARSVHPDITIATDWTGTRNASDKICCLLEDFISRGVDVYFNGIHAALPMQTAMDRGIFAIGFGTDLSAFASRQLLTSAVFDWSIIYEKLIRDLKQGSLTPGHRCEGLESGATRLGRLSPAVPSGVIEDVERLENDLREGRFKVFTGPIFDTSGRLRIGRDKSATQDQMKHMDWLISGIDPLPAPRPERRYRIYIVQSYENDHVCGIPQERGIRAVIRDRLGDGVEIRTHYMNTKTVNSSPSLMRADAVKALRAIDAFKPDLVFTLDDNAFREVGLELADKPFPVVFSGLNGQPRDYNRILRFLNDAGMPTRNITGVYEKLHILTALNVMQEVLPDIRHVVALLDDTPTGRAIRKQLQHEMSGQKASISLTIRTVSTLNDYLREIERLNADPMVQAVYPAVLSVKNRQGKSVGSRDTLRIFLQRSRKPGIPINFAFAKLGLFGGASVDFGAMGEQAGNMGVHLLRHQNTRPLPIESAHKAVITFNAARAGMLGIEIPNDVLATAEVFTDGTLLDSRQPTDPAGE